MLNQLTAATFAARGNNTPFWACMALVARGGIACRGQHDLEAGFFRSLVCCASSAFFSTAERQFRFPLEMGGAQKTAHNSAQPLARAQAIPIYKEGVCISHVTPGKDGFGIADANNMGRQAAFIAAHFRDTQTTEADFDAIYTRGDLPKGKLGLSMLCDMFGRRRRRGL